MEEYTLILYLKGELNAHSSKKVEEWICLSEENRKIVENIYVLLFVDERIRARKEIDIHKAFDDFRQKNYTLSSTRKTKKKISWKKAASIAAIFVAGLLSATLLLLTALESKTKPIAVSTKLGERAHVTLPDGSKVWLNACSHLEYKKSFFSRKRKAILNGEAYFEIAHNASQPFVVSHQNSEINVLGTKFNLRCNSDEDYLKSTLLDGSICFRSDQGQVNIKLKPGEELIFDELSRQTQVRMLKIPQETLTWIEGKLLFENASLRDIAKSLERNYNVRIHFADEDVKQKRFNAEFEVADNIYQILSILELTNKFKYHITDDRNIVIYNPHNEINNVNN